MKTLEQERSNYAFKCISEIKELKDISFEKNASSLISKLGTLILTNGLGNTLAFLFAKGKDHHLEVIAIISNWLFRQEGQKEPGFKRDNVKNEIEKIMKKLVLDASVEQYMYYTEETLRLVNWLRRFSDAMLESGGENE
ncbi:type III-B CRISPR module-associated protein Cmr5 [Sulfurihydrogenibium yellowstonense]|uniref:CRISPR type III-B/RAMP module-associated protein Cmr5 n=1 Tax=Sulfurihydrogenibium yellowstonense SS-5 TaxID=432331 RepID=C4FJQ4_9AQUI|nr:type III-B CRISPR module-associated protein Cmr5 [Sulfurihydrogenibium yellowstonense]EEP60692.1 crispr-associated protein, Cmr5 family [Sulfurihydrogenibium yellowstonense SS-5]